MAESKLRPKHLIVFFAVVLIVGAGAGGTYLADRLYLKPLREQQQMVASLKSIAERLSATERVAEVAVAGQTLNPLRTRFYFVEVDAKGEPIGPRKEFTIDGDKAYFDAWVIKFADAFTPLNDTRLRSEDAVRHLAQKSLILFRGTFGANQKPKDAFPLDSPGEAPAPYTGKAPPAAFERQLWSEFWELANNPELARQRGVYAAHGEAPSMELRPGMVYILEQRLTGGLSIRSERVRAVLKQDR